MTNPCGVCGLPVGTKKSARMRLKRPDGLFDHTWCAMDMSPMEFRALDMSGPPRKVRKTSSSGLGWVRVDDIPGGWLVRCRLCGGDVKRFFMAADTNHAEAFRLATAYETRHRMSRMHGVALGAFRADVEPLDNDELVLAKLFGWPLPRECDRKRRTAKRAASTVLRMGGGPVDD